MKEDLIVYCGMDGDEQPILALLSDRYQTVEIAEEALEKNTSLSQAQVVLLGAASRNPVHAVQKIYAADKHISIIILAAPGKAQQVRQSLQFAPFVGKNAMVVPLNPDLNVVDICANAIMKTRQKRSFAGMNVNQPVQATPERVRPSQMGTFLEHAPIGAILITHNGKVVNYNKAVSNLLPGLQQQEVSLFQHLPASAAEALKNFLDSDHSADATVEIQLQQRTMEVSSSSVHSDEGDHYLLLLMNDVTERKQEVQRIHAVLEALPQMAWTTNTAGAAFYFNHAWYHYTGQSKVAALGWGWSTVVHADDLQKLTELWQTSVEKGSPLQLAARYRNNKQEYRWHLTKATPIRNVLGEVTMWVGTCTDVHDQVLLTEELERKVKERTITLEAMNAELEQFAHVSSHDLQEPLRKIRTFAELLKDHSYDVLDEPSRKYLDKINSTAERMSNSLKALLNYTKMQRVDKFVAVDLDQVVNNVLVDLELVIQQKNATISKDVLPVLKAAPVQMQQLFYNLLNNALKFSKPGVPPRVDIKANTVDGKALLQQFPHLDEAVNYLEITVADNGIGFDSRHANKIFSIFQRLHKKTDYEGTGIGLSLVKRVVQNHRGEVYAVSAEGKGAAFHVLLPQDL